MATTSDGNYQISDLAMIFTQQSPSELRALGDSIRERGLQKPIVLWQGQIIDGRHRYEACMEAGVAPHFMEIPGGLDPLEYVLDENLFRRHMSESQRAISSHRLWEESSRGWPGLGQQETCANLHRFSQQEAAERFNVSRRMLDHARRVMGQDSQAVPELRRAAEQGTLAVSDAAKVANEPPDIQLRALELVHSGRSRTIAAAAKAVLQEVNDRQREDSPPHQVAGGSTLFRSAVGELCSLVAGESVDVIITFPATDRRYLSTFTDLASFAAHSLRPSGVLVVMASGENLPDVLGHLQHPGLHWVCEFDYYFGEPPGSLRGKHQLQLRRRPLLVYGKSHFRLNGGHDMVNLSQPEHMPRPGERLEQGMRAIVPRFAQPGQLVCDPIMLGRAGVALGAAERHCAFIGADREQSSLDRIRRRMETEEMSAASLGDGDDGASARSQE